MRMIFSKFLYSKNTGVIPQWANDLDGAIITFGELAETAVEIYGNRRVVIRKSWCRPFDYSGRI